MVIPLDVEKCHKESDKMSSSLGEYDADNDEHDDDDDDTECGAFVDVTDDTNIAHGTLDAVMICEDGDCVASVMLIDATDCSHDVIDDAIDDKVIGDDADCGAAVGVTDATDVEYNAISDLMTCEDGKYGAADVDVVKSACHKISRGICCGLVDE